jgi:NADPH2:quinone reductase
MHAVLFERYGGPEVLDYREVDDPSPGPDQVLVDVEAVGVKPRRL